MKYQSAVFVSATLACGLLFSSAGLAAKFNKQVDFGDKAPDFKDLEGVDGKTHSFANYKDAQVVVLTFICNHCPVAQAYEKRFISFVKQFKKKGVVFVAISCNKEQSDWLEKMKQRAQQRGFNFDYLQDPTQKVGRALGATVTPHLFVFDKDRRIAYMGAFDDSLNPSRIERHYVIDAVNALLRGQQPEIKESRQFGCRIEYERK